MCDACQRCTKNRRRCGYWARAVQHALQTLEEYEEKCYELHKKTQCGGNCPVDYVENDEGVGFYSVDLDGSSVAQCVAHNFLLFPEEKSHIYRLGYGSCIKWEGSKFVLKRPYDDAPNNPKCCIQCWDNDPDSRHKLDLNSLKWEYGGFSPGDDYLVDEEWDSSDNDMHKWDSSDDDAQQ